MRFEAILVDESGAPALVSLDDSDLMDGDVDLEVSHSAINFKDGLALTGKGKVIRRFPMIPGVDLAGRVIRSRDSRYAPGDLVVATGCGLGESHYGGFAQKARLAGDWLTPLPAGLTPARAMALGTAGITAMFCVLALEKFGRAPADGPVVVTGAAGGVGSLAVALLAARGWRVAAVTGRPEEEAFLRGLGASDIVPRASLAEPGKPLQERRYAAAVDTVGGVTLANLLAQMDWGGAVAATGNVGGMEFPGNVAPFILRGVALLGVESVRPQIELRRAAWTRLAADLPPELIDAMHEIAPFSQILDRAQAIVAGKIRGRCVIEM